MNKRHPRFTLSILSLAIAGCLPLIAHSAAITPIISNVTTSDASGADGRGKTFLDSSASSAPNGWNQWNSSVSSSFAARDFSSHYRNNIGLQSQVSLTNSWNYLSSHTVTLTITNAGAWELDIDLNRFGLINVNLGSGGGNLGGDGNITVQALTTTIGGATLKSGSLNLAADAERIIDSANSYNYTVNQNNTATVQGNGPTTITLASKFNINARTKGGTTRNAAVSWVAGQNKQNENINGMAEATDDQGVKMAGVLRTSIPMNDAGYAINENMGGVPLFDFNNSETGKDLSFDNKPVSYSIIAGNDAGLFSINASTGQVSIAAGKQLDYEAAAQHTLTIQASNAGLNNTAQLVVNVLDVNEAPTAAADSGAVDAGQSTTIDVLSNDTDPDTNPSYNTLQLTNLNTAGTRGQVSIVNGKVSYQATGFDDLLIGQTAQDTFQYQVSDGALTSWASVTVTVNGTKPLNSAPVANTDLITIDAGQSMLIDAKLNDTDADGDNLSVVNINNTGTIGSLSFANGQITYYATGFDDLMVGETAQDSLIYQVSDGELSSWGTISITINGTKEPNRAPVANGDSATVDAGQTTTIAVLTNDTDEDGDSLTISNLNTAGTIGTASIAGGQISYQATGFDDLLIGQTAQDSFQYEVTDGEFTALATVTVTISGTKQPNRAPVANGDSATVDAGQTTAITVLTNDSDEDGDSLTISNLNTAGTIGTVSIAGGQISYQATGFDDLLIGQTAQDSFQYEVSDGELTSVASVTVTISGTKQPNRAPVANGDSATVDAGQTTAITVLTNDSDEDGDSLTISNLNTAGTTGTVSITGGQISYQATGFDDLLIGQTAQDSFQYEVSDGNLSTWATVTVTVFGQTAANEAPTAQADSFTVNANKGETLNVLGNDTDPEQDALSIELDVTGTQGAVAVFNNQVIYDPAAFSKLPINSTATDTFQYRVSDGSNYSSWVTVTITVNGVYVEPVCTGPSTM